MRNAVHVFMLPTLVTLTASAIRRRHTLPCWPVVSHCNSFKGQRKYREMTTQTLMLLLINVTVLFSQKVRTLLMNWYVLYVS